MDSKNLASAIRGIAKDVDEISEDAAELDREDAHVPVEYGPAFCMNLG